ncbi:uncharacterized protein LY89DRAFT_742535 [Mollisia scopiformis]|uniref:Zn(2)-C6 fungal-type domain-containing protein n=1 Tax=Mollisia scopiformis TaxID=149040 RepID=A0A132B5T6_MOLSC|nr:uncharacterized protein LY89DRAFT_742535 [Mollisia scopiformis]KUJ07762.1 hypothetical protein LY89DRAFT_742535 [Mollisia scopiformis]
MSSAGERQQKRNQKACTTCRQVKLRCDSHERFPAPCTRCLKKNIQCRIDPDFKRTRTRNRLDEVTNQLNAIQKTLADQSQRGPASVPDSSTLGPSLAVETTNFNEVDHTFYQYSNIDDLPDSPLILNLASLEADHVKSLFSHFEKYYYRHCPILDTSMSFSSLHQSSPILFWTIIIISSRWHPTLHVQYNLFLEPYRHLLGQMLVNQIFFLETIQALTLLSFWPLAVPRQVEDPSWNYCGLITNAARKLGLDKARPSSSDSTSVTKHKTWVAIVQANCSHGWTSGVTVSAELLSSVGSTSPNCAATAEMEFFLKAEILRKLARYSSMIINFKADMDSLPFVQGLCTDLENSKDGYEEYCSMETDIVILGAQLCIYALHIDQERRMSSVPTSSRTSLKDKFTARRDCINLAYMTAAKLVHHFSEMVGNNVGSVNEHDQASMTLQRYLPKHYFGLLLLSMVFIYRTKLLQASSTKSLPSNPEAHVSQVYQLLISWSREPLDEPARAARVIRVMLGAETQGQLKIQDSNGEGRPGISFLDEIINTAREIRQREETGVEVLPSESGNVTLPGSETYPTMPDFQSLPLESIHDPSLEWSFPWGLDLLSTEQYNFDINNFYNGFS